MADFFSKFVDFMKKEGSKTKETLLPKQDKDTTIAGHIDNLAWVGPRLLAEGAKTAAKGVGVVGAPLLDIAGLPTEAIGTALMSKPENVGSNLQYMKQRRQGGGGHYESMLNQALAASQVVMPNDPIDTYNKEAQKQQQKKQKDLVANNPEAAALIAQDEQAAVQQQRAAQAIQSVAQVAQQEQGPASAADQLQEIVNDPEEVKKMSVGERLLFGLASGMMQFGGKDPSALFKIAAEKYGTDDDDKTFKRDLAKIKFKAGLDLAKDQRKTQEDFFSNLLVEEPMSGTDATKLGLLDTAIDSVDSLSEALNEDPDVLKNFNRPGNPVGQMIATLKTDIANSILRIESGAAITEDDQKFISGLLTTQGIKAYLTDPATQNLRLKKIKDKLSVQRNFMRPNETVRNYVKEARTKGISDDDVFSYLQSKGWA